MWDSNFRAPTLVYTGDKGLQKSPPSLNLWKMLDITWKLRDMVDSRKKSKERQNFGTNVPMVHSLACFSKMLNKKYEMS